MPAGRAIDRLKKAANLKSTRRAVILANGDEFEFWAKPLTMSERERAQKDAKSEEITQYALQLVVSKCLDENGGRMFNPGDISVLRNEVRDRPATDHGGSSAGRSGGPDGRAGHESTKELEQDNWLMLSFGIAKELGYTVQELHERISMEELLGWAAYFGS